MTPTHPSHPVALEPKANVLNVHDLFGPRREVKLRFRGEEYCLRITRNEKLILTK